VLNYYRVGAVDLLIAALLALALLAETVRKFHDSARSSTYLGAAKGILYQSQTFALYGEWQVITMTKTILQLPILNRYPWLLPLAPLSALLFTFGKLAEDVWGHEAFAWDAPILLNIHKTSSPLLDKIMLLLTYLGGASSMASLAGLVLAGLLYFRRWVQGTFFALAVGGAALLNPLLKQIFHRARPDLWPQLRPERDYSFPSGHAMGSMAVVAGLVILAWPTRWRWWVLGLGALFVLGVGASRLYLGVHFPSDVLAGWVAALTWVGGVALTFSIYQSLKGIR